MVSLTFPSMAGCVGVVEERGHFVELALGERVELVIVAYRATGRSVAHPDLRRGFGAVAVVHDQDFIVDTAALVGGRVATIEAGCD